MSYHNYKKLYRKAPRWARITIGALAFILVLATLNLIFQVVRKPAELFFPVSGVLSKTPIGDLARVRGAFPGAFHRGHYRRSCSRRSRRSRAAATRWRARRGACAPSVDPREVYRPASSAVGMYQITDGTFEQAKRYCIRDHVAIEDGCWFNSLYMRVIPSHAVELTSAYLDRSVAAILAGRRLSASAAAKAGPRRLDSSLRRLRRRCLCARAASAWRRASAAATHDVRAYLAQVTALKRVFARLSTLG